MKMEIDTLLMCCRDAEEKVMRIKKMLSIEEMDKGQSI